jgi:hypothetical protein
MSKPPLRSGFDIGVCGVRPTFTKTPPINLLFLDKLRSDSGIIFNNLSDLKKERIFEYT